MNRSAPVVELSYVPSLMTTVRFTARIMSDCMGWFPLDFFTMVPSVIGMYADLQAYSAFVSRSEGNGDGLVASDNSMSNVTVLRVLRAVRMVKLLRLIRASKIFDRWQSRVSLSHATLTVTKCILAVFLFAHWFAVRNGPVLVSAFKPKRLLQVFALT